MNKTEEQFYAVAAEEVASKTFSRGLMAKAMVDADGDGKKTILNYIRLRVAQLNEEFKANILRKEREEVQLRKKRRNRKSADQILAEENERFLKHPQKIGDI